MDNSSRAPAYDDERERPLPTATAKTDNQPTLISAGFNCLLQELAAFATTSALSLFTCAVL